MQTLNATVVAAGRIYPQGTRRDAAKGVPDGPWWDGEPEATQKQSSKTTKTRTGRSRAASGES